MATLPEAARKAWNNKQDLMIFSTADAQGTPNSIYVLWAKLINDEQFLIVNNFFNKTLANINSGSKGSLLYLAPEREAYQIKGSLEYHTSGPVYDDMKSWLDPKFNGTGATVLNIEEVYYGAEKLV